MTTDRDARGGYAVLVADAHERMSLAVVRSLGRAGYLVHACSSQPKAIGFFSNYLSHGVRCPKYGSGQFVAWLRSYCARHDIRCIVPTEPFLLDIRPAFAEFAGLIPVSADESIVYDGLSKWELFSKLGSARAGRAEIDSHLPQHVLALGTSPLSESTALQQLAAPLFVKADGCHARDTHESIVVTVAEASAAEAQASMLLEHFDRVLVQEWVPGVGVGAFVLRWQGRVVAQFMHIRLHELPGSGWSAYRQSWWHQAIMDDALAKLAHLEWEGVAMMEYRWDQASGKFWLIEMNGRFWGSLHLALYAGLDFPRLLLDTFAGFGTTSVSPVFREVRCLNGVLEARYIISRLRDPRVAATAKLGSLWEYLCLALDPRIASDMRFPGDSKLFWIELWQYLQKAVVVSMRLVRSNTRGGAKAVSASPVDGASSGRVTNWPRTAQVATPDVGGLQCVCGHLASADWHDILQSFQDATIDQTWAYAAARVAPLRLDHFVVRRGKTVVAAAQIVVYKIPFLRAGVAFVKFGPLWRPSDPAREPVDLTQVVNLMLEEYSGRRGLYLRIMPRAEATDDGTLSRALARAGYRQVALASPERYLVDVGQALDEVRASMKPKWRSHLRKSEKNGLVVQIEPGAQAVGRFASLYREMVGRKRFEDGSSIDHLEVYAPALPQTLAPVWMICYAGKQPVAGAVVSRIGDTAQYLFGATSQRGLELRAGYFIQWAAVQWLHERGCRWYDLGGDCNDAGLRQFKSGLVGRSGVVVPLPGYFDGYGAVCSRVAAALAFRVRDLRTAWASRLVEARGRG